jgi:hypothetical protein
LPTPPRSPPPPDRDWDTSNEETFNPPFTWTVQPRRPHNAPLDFTPQEGDGEYLLYSREIGMFEAEAEETQTEIAAETWARVSDEEWDTAIAEIEAERRERVEREEWDVEWEEVASGNEGEEESGVESGDAETSE